MQGQVPTTGNKTTPPILLPTFGLEHLKPRKASKSCLLNLGLILTKITVLKSYADNTIAINPHKSAIFVEKLGLRHTKKMYIYDLHTSRLTL